ncbi:major facilitator superfamily MFS_1 [Kribbella flavida DSM 17836]|uniref:Major facilitator superfamily MFS_1 n=1 Tax=Kribbella flavida (strain DSM 17836 / JCM 10339 / NBRC 14399) TaxID=479435 RepID=D2PT07_KRIFD|nr:MFS transporter [Kribbella flavida]ADB35059.1 major facilitator superfamily MFS_1 [Kribbella flavida DSM 17836]
MRPTPRTSLVTLFAADILSALGTRVSAVAIPWLVLMTTGSAAKMGLIAAAEMLPYALTGVLAAPLADRFGLRRTSIVTDAGSALAMVTVILSPGSSFLQLAALVAIGGALRGIGDRVKHVMLRPLAEQCGVQMLRITSLYEGLSRAATLVGAPLGGLLIAWLGTNGALWADAVSFAVCAALVAALVALPPEQSPEVEAPAREPYWTALRGGFSFLRADQVLIGMMVMTFAINVFSQASGAVFTPLWVEEVVGSPVVLGLLFGGFAGGALLGNLIFTVYADRIPPYRAFVIGALVGGAPRLLTMGLSDQVWLVVSVSFLCGIANASLNPVIGVTLYERVPPALQTRVFGVIGAITFAGIPVGSLLGGWSVALFGLRPALLLAGGLFLLATLIPVVQMYRRPLSIPTYGATTSPKTEEAA